MDISFEFFYIYMYERVSFKIQMNKFKLLEYFIYWYFYNINI